MNTKWDYKI